MNQDKPELVQILADYVWRRDTKPIDNAKYDSIINQARDQCVEGIVYYQCAENLPKRLSSQSDTVLAATLYEYVNRKAEEERIAEALRCRNIPFFFVKGIAVSSYYPISALRTMGDSDLVVSPTYFLDAVNVMHNLGYDGAKTGIVEQWGCQRNNIHVELHSVLIKPYERLDSKIKSFFNEFSNYADHERLNWNFHFLYIIVHLRRHVMNNGAGLRQFMDLAVLTLYNKELDWKWITDKLMYLGIGKFANVCFSLLKYWFDIDAPFQTYSIDYQFANQLTDQILRGGVFGLNTEEKKGKATCTSIIEMNGPMWIRRIVYIVQRVFPRYELMCEYPYCHYLYKRKFLLPVSWVHRFCKIIKNREMVNLKDTIVDAMVPQTEIASQKQYLVNMGIVEKN